MSEIIYSAISSFIEPPIQTASFLATSQLLNVVAPRIISNGKYYAIHATDTTSSCSSSSAPFLNNNDKENENTSTTTTSSTIETQAVHLPTTTSSSSSSVRKTSASNPNLARVTIAQKSRLGYQPLTQGFSNFIFQWAGTSEFVTALHFRLVRGADPKVMERNIQDCVNRAQYARRVFFQQGSLNGIDLSKCFANAKMIEEIYFMTTPTPENIQELSLVAPNLKILYCSCAEQITNQAIIKFCEGRKQLYENSKSSYPTSLHKLLLWKGAKLNSVEAFKAIASLPALEILSLRGCAGLLGSDFEKINACVAALSSIPRLWDFDLEATLSDASLRSIGEGLPLLKKLYFYACGGVKDCSVDRGFYHLFRGLHQIREFSISSEMAPEALEELARCRTLKVLKLYECEIKDKDLACLSALDQLEVLQLAHCDSFVLPTATTTTIENETENENSETKNKRSGFSQVSNGNLKRLVLNYCRGITSEIYAEIANSFPQLRELQVFTAEAPVRDEDLQALSRLSNIEDLLLNDVSRQGKATKAGIKFLGRKNLKYLRALDLSGMQSSSTLSEEKIWKIIEQN